MYLNDNITPTPRQKYIKKVSTMNFIKESFENALKSRQTIHTHES